MIKWLKWLENLMKTKARPYKSRFCLVYCVVVKNFVFHFAFIAQSMLKIHHHYPQIKKELPFVCYRCQNACLQHYESSKQKLQEDLEGAHNKDRVELQEQHNEEIETLR